MRFTIRKKLGLGFAMMIALTMATATVVFVKIRSMRSLQATVLEVREPTTRAAIELMNGVNHSLAALRGYIILGKPKFKDQRRIAWENIDRSLATMRDLSQHWNVSEDVQRLDELSLVFREFATAQESVEAVVWTDDNTPALKLLQTEAAPRVNEMLDALTALVMVEKYQEGTEDRKSLLAAMADARGSLAVGLGAIRSYLTTGNQEDADVFTAKWDVHGEAAGALESDSWMFTDEQTASFEVYRNARAIFEPLPEQMFDIRASEKFNVGNYLLGAEAAPRAERIATVLRDLMASQQSLTTQDRETLATASSLLATVTVGAALAALIIGCVIAVGVARQITAPIRLLTENMRDIAEGEGDLTRRVDDARKDELGELGKWFNVFVEKIRGVVSDVSGNAREVAAASTEIASSSEELSSGMENQQRQTGQVSAAVEEMSASVSDVAKKASDAAKLSTDAGDQAKQGGEVVARTVEGMNAISQQVNESATAVGELGKRGEQIGEVISVINDIADQTNLLALNAAIEAARAGEHGRGFAVVADEVRKLAERTTKATEEVGESIKAIQSETERAVERMQEGTQRVEEGVALADEAGASLKSIVDGAQSVAGMIQSIAAAAEEQNAASAEISRNVEGINAVTSESAEGVKQAAGAATQLSTKSEQLMALVSKFKVGE